MRSITNSKLLNRLKNAAIKAGVECDDILTPEQHLERHAAEGREQSLNIQRQAIQDYNDKLMRESEVVIEGKTFENFEIKDDWRGNLFKACGEFASDAVYGTGNNSLLLCGEYGSGKTHLASAVTNYIVKNRHGTTFLAKQWDNVIRKIFSATANKFDADQFVRVLGSVDILIIDELAANESELSTAKLQILGEICRTRANKGGITIITTNHDARSICDVLGSFVVNGLREKGLTLLGIEKGENRNYRPIIEGQVF